MGEPATVAMLWGLAGAGVAALAAVCLWLWKGLRDKANAVSVERLWSQFNVLQQQFNAYQVEVAKTYVTAEQVRQLEGRLTHHFDEKWRDIKDTLRTLPRRGEGE